MGRSPFIVDARKWRTAVQQSHPQSQPSQQPQQSPQQLQHSQQSPQSQQSPLWQSPSSRSCRSTGRRTRRSTSGTCRPARPTPRSPASSPRRSRRAARGAAAGPGPPGGAYGLPGAASGRPRPSPHEAAVAEGPVHGAAQLVREQHDAPACRRSNSASRSASRMPCSASSAQPPGLGERGAGRGERVPGARRGVSFLVLHGVQQMREPAEEPAGLGERLGVARPPGEDGGVREGGGGRRLGRFGDRQQRVPGPASASMPTCRSTASTRTAVSKPTLGARCGRPARSQLGGHPAGGGGHRPARQQPVPVGDMVAHLGRGEHQRDGGGEPRALALGDRTRCASRAAGRARPCAASPAARSA